MPPDTGRKSGGPQDEIWQTDAIELDDRKSEKNGSDIWNRNGILR